MGPRADLDAVVKRKIFCTCQESNPGRPARSLVTISTGGFKQSKLSMS